MLVKWNYTFSTYVDVNIGVYQFEILLSTICTIYGHICTSDSLRVLNFVTSIILRSIVMCNVEQIE
jgi:hypothetical protein